MRPSSRTKMALAGITVEPDLMIAAATLDTMQTLVWMLSADGARGSNRPRSVLGALLGNDKKENNEELTTFDSGEDFMQAYKN